MVIRKKSKEELQNQAEGFLDYAERKGRRYLNKGISKVTRKKISETLGLSETDKKGFCERLCKKFGKELDIGDEKEIKKILSRKKFDFGLFSDWVEGVAKSPFKSKYGINSKKLWEEYTKYVASRAKAKHLLEKYESMNSNLYKVIFDFLFESFYNDEKLNLANLKVFLGSNAYKQSTREVDEYGNIKNSDIFQDFLRTICEYRGYKFYGKDKFVKILNGITDKEFKLIMMKAKHDEMNDKKVTIFNDEQDMDEYLEFKKHEELFESCGFGLEKFLDTIVVTYDSRVGWDKSLYEQRRNQRHMFLNYLENFKFLHEKFKESLEEDFYKSEDIPDIAFSVKPENLKFIFEKYAEQNEEVTITNLRLLTNLLGSLNIDDLKIILDKFKINDFIELCNTKIGPDNLKIILDRFDDIDNIKELAQIIRVAKPENLRIILDRFDDIDNIKELAQIIRDAKPENLKIIFEEYDKQAKKLTLKDLNELNNVLCLATPENLELIFEKFLDRNNNITVNDLKEFDILLRFRYGLPKDLVFKESNKKGYLNGLTEIVNSNYDNELKCNMVRTLVSLNFEEAGNLLKVYKMLDNSISPDIQLIKNQLIVEILKARDPLTLSKIIINIFEKNNLPMTGKIFKIFELLYPKSRIEGLFKKYPYSSPELKSLLDEGKNVYELIYKDLMNIAVKSGDRSLREYLKTFIGSEQLLRDFETIINEEGFNSDDNLCLKGKLDEEKQAQLLYLFRRISVLYNRYYGKEIYEDGSIESLNVGKSTVTDNQLVKYYNDIKKGFHLKNGELIYNRLQRFLRGLGYESFQEVLDEMDKSKKCAHEKGLKLYNESEGGKIKFPEEAFVKGVSDLSFKKIIGRGITSREYLGSGYDIMSTGVCGSGWGNSATSDTTPFDIDGFCSDHFVKAGSSGGISGSDKESSIGYGYVNFVIDITKKDENGNLIIYDNTPNKNDKNKLRWDTIRRNNFNVDEKYNTGQYELFQTETSEGIEHCGIRTGIAMTEVDYIIYTGNFEGKDFQDMCYEIARNGYYIPVTDGEGNIRFTPEMYHRIRAGFNYMEYYDGYDVELKDGKYISKKNDNTVNKTYNGDNEKIKDSELGELIAENSPKNEKYQKFAEENRELAESTLNWIMEILYNECGIKFNNVKFDTSITGAELHDSGSTGRGTDIPTKDVDLDFTLLLDADDYDNKLELIKDTIYKVTETKDTSKGGPRRDSGGRELGYQIKSQGNILGKSDERPDGIPLDLLILKKSQVIDYSSSDAMKEKLNYIASNPQTGVEDLDRVRTNVIIMKKLLKGKNCYKKSQAEGGIAGIGVENWIAQHHGSFVEALESFEEVAYGGKYEEGRPPLSLKDFQELYPIYDAGENYKNGCNDNFVYKLNEHGYDGMLQIVKALRLEGIDGIRKIIKDEYEKNKKKFTG